MPNNESLLLHKIDEFERDLKKLKKKYNTLEINKEKKQPQNEQSPLFWINLLLDINIFNSMKIKGKTIYTIIA